MQGKEAKSSNRGQLTGVVGGRPWHDKAFGHPQVAVLGAEAAQSCLETISDSRAGPQLEPFRLQPGALLGRIVHEARSHLLHAYTELEAPGRRRPVSRARWYDEGARDLWVLAKYTLRRCISL